MEWARILAFITGTVDQELLLRNEYLAAEMGEVLAARAMLSFEMADDRCDGGAPSHLPFDPAIGNSLLLESNSLIPRK